MSDDDLLPLPPCDASPVTGSIVYHTYSAGTMHDYASACVAAALAKRQDAWPTVLQIVYQQSCDEGLWFEAHTAPEAYLQQELRRLHAAMDQELVMMQRLRC